MKVLSLFDGMACGMLAMQKAGIEVERYVAYEIDKYAVQTSSHNFPMIEHRGDVFQADFTEFSGFDFLIGGSPCTYWSIAQKNNRETEASGMGWELFSQYVRALHEAKPRFFIYENNKSMSKAIRASIDEAFGFEAVCINSALVSAQNRNRLYWVGKRNEDGTYSKVDIEQPEDRGILLKDVLENGLHLNPIASGKSRTVDAHMGNCENNLIPRINHPNPSKQQYDCMVEPVNITDDGKSQTIKAQYNKNSVANFCCYSSTYGASGVAEPVPFGETAGGKSFCLTARYYKGIGAAPNKVLEKSKDSMVAVPVATNLYAIPCSNMPVREATKKGYTEIEPMQCVDMTQPNSKTRRGRNMADKSNCCMTSCQHYQYCGVLGYATPCEWDENGNVVKAISVADGKTYPVYEVKDGQITINGKQYPIKLVDGFYIIRKLTVRECMRLQTVPEWYEFPVSDTQAYKMLGNGWTVDVIAHLLTSTKGVSEHEHP